MIANDSRGTFVERRRPKSVRFRIGASLGVLVAFLLWFPVGAQIPTLRYGEGVPAEARLISKRALEYLSASQGDNGAWQGGQSGAGITGICLMALMSGGEDPDFGIYSEHIRRALQRIIIDQNSATGMISGPGHGSMYHHGFAMLALSEAYGMVDEQRLWQESQIPLERRRTIGQALELAVRCAVTAQKNNPWKGWRYSASSTDADTTVTGTMLMGLLGARNAGLSVPNEAVTGALGFFRLNTMSDGNVSYQPASSHGTGLTRSAIATLVYAIAKQKDTEEYQLASASIKSRVDQSDRSYKHYYRYYMAQALFQSDPATWQTWNRRLIEQLLSEQREDGSFTSGHGQPYATGMTVLALALNYRLLPVYER